MTDSEIGALAAVLSLLILAGMWLATKKMFEAHNDDG